MQRLRILVILILLSLMPLYSLAVLNEGQYAFRSLDINNGLSQNTVHAILQDKQGFMWFGTKDGLDRYDGISFRTFMKESGTLGNNFLWFYARRNNVHNLIPDFACHNINHRYSIP